MRAAAWWLGTLLVAGCFQEAGSTSGCEQGTPGCPCSAGACDPGLVCEPTVALCIPENCDPGTALCTCFEGECFGALQCAPDGLCRDTGGSTTVVTDASTTAISTTEASGTTSTGTSLSLTNAELTSDDATLSVGETLMPEVTGEPDGSACRGCIDAANGDERCELAYAVCADNMQCVALVECVGDCLENDAPACTTACCTTFPEGTSAYAPVAACNQLACPDECAGFVLACG